MKFEFEIPKNVEVPEFKSDEIPGKIIKFDRSSRLFENDLEYDKLIIKGAFKRINTSLEVWGFISYENIILDLGIMKKDPDIIDATKVYRANNGKKLGYSIYVPEQDNYDGIYILILEE